MGIVFLLGLLHHIHLINLIDEMEVAGYNHNMNFIAIDFETANEMMSSPCALGLAVVEQGEIIERRSWLIRPHELRITAVNYSIHGISEDDVRNEPELSDLWFLIRGYLEGHTVLAHNAGFDMTVLKSTLDLYEIPAPEFEYFCTVDISRKVWPRPEIENHKLNTVASHLKFSFSHHNASDDACAAAVIALEAAKKSGIETLHELTAKLNLQPKRFEEIRVKNARFPGRTEKPVCG